MLKSLKTRSDALASMKSRPANHPGMTLMGALAAILGLLLTGCSSMAAEETVSVSLTPVNYTENEYAGYLLASPEKPTERKGGEPIGAYSAGGIMCCFDLPKVWHPGIKVIVSLKRGSQAKTYAEWDKEKIPFINTEVEIPPYADGIPSTLWTLILPDNKVEVVSSRYDPNHASWPASVKGWPVPSTEYRRKLWDRDMEILNDSLEKLQEGSKESAEKEKKYKDNIIYLKQRIKEIGPRP